MRSKARPLKATQCVRCCGGLSVGWMPQQETESFGVPELGDLAEGFDFMPSSAHEEQGETVESDAEELEESFGAPELGDLAGDAETQATKYIKKTNRACRQGFHGDFS